MAPETDDRPPGINWVQVIAAAGAAVSSAVLLSTLGVAGTIVGAAVGSVIASIASHTYSRGIQASREQALALTRIAVAREDLSRVAGDAEGDPEAGLEHADRELGRAEAQLEGRSWRGLPWRKVAFVAAGVFVGVMVAITAFELVSGRAVSSYTGGSDRDTRITVPGVSGGNSDRDDRPRQQTDDPTEAPTESPTGTPTETPTEEPTEEPTETPTPPTETPTTPPPTTPTGTPTTTPTAEPTIGD